MTSQSFVVLVLAIALAIGSLFAPSGGDAPGALDPGGHLSADVLAVVEGETVPLLASSESDEVIMRLDKADSLIVVETSGDRYRVRTISGTEGYVPRYLVRPVTAEKVEREFLVLGYYMQDTTNSAWRSLYANVDVLSAVSPWSWGLTAAGDLRTVYFSVSHLADVLSYAGRSGVSTHALIHNFNPDKGVFDPDLADRVLADPTVRRQAVENIVTTVTRWGMSGIHIDFEGVAAARRDDLTTFVAELAEAAIPYNLTVSMAVPAKTAAAHGGLWVKAYDYESLARHVDFLVVMAYDQHWRGDVPGPVAAVPWVRDVIEYALDPDGGAVPADKLVLGIPAYGYDWPGGGRWADAVTHRQAMDRLGTAVGRDGTVALQWHGTFLAPYFSYAGRTVWFENEHSVAHKLLLALEYDLAGVAFWRLGQEDPHVWDMIRRVVP